MSKKAIKKQKGISLADCELIKETTNYMYFNPTLHGKTLLELGGRDNLLWVLKPDAPPHCVDGFKKYKKINGKIVRKIYKDFYKTIADDENAPAMIMEYKKYMIANPDAHGKMLKEMVDQEIPAFIAKPDAPPDLICDGEKYEDLLFEIFYSHIDNHENCSLLRYSNE